MLNNLYNMFDDRIDNYNAYKVQFRSVMDHSFETRDPFNLINLAEICEVYILCVIIA